MSLSCNLLTWKLFVSDGSFSGKSYYNIFITLKKHLYSIAVMSFALFTVIFHMLLGIAGLLVYE